MCQNADRIATRAPVHKDQASLEPLELTLHLGECGTTKWNLVINRVGTKFLSFGGMLVKNIIPTNTRTFLSVLGEITGTEP